MPPPRTPKPLIHRVREVLSTVFYVIWIIIGLLLLLFIWANIRRGAFTGLFGQPVGTPQQQVQAAGETELPGVGKVNIECVQSALSIDAIQKLLEEGNASKLTDQEKTQLGPCIIQEATPSPQ